MSIGISAPVNDPPPKSYDGFTLFPLSLFLSPVTTTTTCFLPLYDCVTVTVLVSPSQYVIVMVAVLFTVFDRLLAILAVITRLPLPDVALRVSQDPLATEMLQLLLVSMLNKNAPFIASPDINISSLLTSSSHADTDVSFDTNTYLNSYGS